MPTLKSKATPKKATPTKQPAAVAVWRQTIGRVPTSALDREHGELTVLRYKTGPWLLVVKEVSEEREQATTRRRRAGRRGCLDGARLVNDGSTTGHATEPNRAPAG